MYRAEPLSSLLIEPLDELTAVYHRASGITHLLAPPAPELLHMLQEPATADQLLARLGDAPEGSQRMTDLADGVVYSRSGLTYQAQVLEQRGLVTRAPGPDDERSVTVTITDVARVPLRAAERV